jgi:hypothetical protein
MASAQDRVTIYIRLEKYSARQIILILRLIFPQFTIVHLKAKAKLGRLLATVSDGH